VSETTAAVSAVLDDRVQAYVAERLASRSEPRLVALAGDASTRRYFRVLRDCGSDVLALYPEPFELPDLAFAGLRGLLAGWGLPVPEIRDHDGARGILLLEDLGDLTLQEVLKTAGPAERDDSYREAVDQMVTLQRESARGPRTAACFQVAFDVEKLVWELHYFEKHFLEGHRGRDLTVEDRATLAEAFHNLASEIASWRRVLCHRDFHSRNLMRHRGVLYWIDFQDARMGPPHYDLSSLLRDSYVDLPEEMVAERAFEFRRKAVPEEPPELFERRFELTSVQRNLKALGTFGYMASVRGNPVYLPYMPRTLASVRRNLLRRPELASLHRVLARHLEELA
jgi:hypothetical protein